MISQERLKEILDYDPITGMFTWKIDRTFRIKIGSRAGSPSTDGHRRISIDNKRYKEHTLAWFYTYGVWPKRLDHKSKKRWDNRLENLRECTQSQNIANSSLSRKNTSGYKGVSWNKHYKMWRAYIRVNYKRHYLGFFSDPVEASKAYKEAALKHFGEFADE